MKLRYRTEKDGIRYPNLQMPSEDNKPIGKYGQMRLAYLKQYRKATYTTLLTEGKLNAYLCEIQEAATAEIEQTVTQMAQSLGVNETMKAQNPMKWVQMMNNIKNSAEEELRETLIFA